VTTTTVLLTRATRVAAPTTTAYLRCYSIRTPPLVLCLLPCTRRYHNLPPSLFAGLLLASPAGFLLSLLCSFHLLADRDDALALLVYERRSGCAGFGRYADNSSPTLTRLSTSTLDFLHFCGFTLGRSHDTNAALCAAVPIRASCLFAPPRAINNAAVVDSAVTFRCPSCFCTAATFGRVFFSWLTFHSVGVLH